MKINLKKIEKILFLIFILLVTAAMFFTSAFNNDYRRFASDTLSYEKATVVKMISEELNESPLKSGQKLGYQKAVVQIDGGKRIEVENYLTETHNIRLEKGLKIILCIDSPENSEPYYTVYNYDRMPAIAAMLIMFFIFMLLVGGKKGFYAALSIVFTLVMILKVTIPAIYSGISPAWSAFLTVFVSTAVTLILLQGFSKQCFLGTVVTLIGECMAAVMFKFFSEWMHLTGFQTENAEGLLLISQNTGMRVSDLLLAGAMIAALGAVMDVSVSIISAVMEVSEAGKTDKKALFKSGINIGRDMIGTMSNTLIFAFVGGAIITMLILYSYGVRFQQLINSDYLCIEMVQGICSTAAVVLTVPSSAFAGAIFFGKNKEEKKVKNNRPYA